MIRMIKVALTESVILPRFSMSAGDTWEVRPDRLTKDGFTLGGGFIKNNQFIVTGAIEMKSIRNLSEFARQNNISPQLAKQKRDNGYVFGVLDGKQVIYNPKSVMEVKEQNNEN